VDTGKSKFITFFTNGKSSPRAPKSVVTRHFTDSSRKIRRFYSLTFLGTSPCNVTNLTPDSFRECSTN